MMIPTREENPTGFHARYKVTKADGTPCDPDAVYFVLRIDAGGKDHAHVSACRSALRTYVDAIWGTTGELAFDLERLLDQQAPISVPENENGTAGE